jgi:diguanylate cyclase (GGDEF)-like protein/PAS domain S-box-containing protein
MWNQAEIYIPLAYLLAAIPYAWLGVYAWRRRPAVAVTSFAWAMLGLSIWTFAYGLEIFFRSLEIKLFLVNIEFIGVIIGPVFLFVFILEFIGKSHLLTSTVRLFLWIVPITALLLVWTNPLHELMWTGERTHEVLGLVLLELQYEAFFWVFAGYVYGLLILGCILLVVEILKRPRIYRSQGWVVIAGILTSLAGNAASLVGYTPIPNLDITPLFFLPMALGFSWAIIRYRLLEVLPIEHLVVLQNMRDGVIVLDPQQRILYLNPAAEQLIRRGENEAVGQPLSQISEMYAETLAPYLTGGEHRAEIKVREGDQIKVFDINASPALSVSHSKEQSNSNSIVILHDITRRKEAEAALSLRESVMSAIGQAAEQFLRDSRWEHNIPGVLEKIGQAADVSRVSVLMNYTDPNGMVHSSLCYEWAAPCAAPQINNPVQRHIPLRKSGFNRWEQTLSQGLPICGFVRDFPEEEQIFFQAQGSISIAAMPIFVDNQWWGFIMFDECRDERHWTNTELEALHIAANIFGSAEIRARAEQKLIRREHTLNFLHEIVRTALQSEDLDSMSEFVVNHLGELIKADGCFLSLWDEEKKLASPLAAYGPYRDKYLTLKASPNEGTFTDLAFKANQPLVIEETNIPPYNEYQLKKVFPVQSILVLPLVSSRKKLGAIMLTFEQAHTFQPDEIAVSEQAAGLIALAMEKFQAVEKARHRADVSEALRKAGAAVTETLETDDTIARILEQLNHVIPYDSASVQLLEGNDLVIVGGRGFSNPKSVLGIRFPITDKPNSIVMETGKPHYIPETGDQYPNFNEIGNLHIHSWLGVPLIFQGKIIGLLTIDSTKSNHFQEEDIKSASEFSNQVAIALENARIFEEAQSRAVTDPLTGLYNRRGLFELGKVEFARSSRLDHPFSAIMLDLDHFKNTNDTYGHAVGDQVLCELVNRCKKCVREIDYIGRYGGEEIIILLPETGIHAGLVVAERLRATIATLPIQINEELKLNITASLGVACRDEHTTSLEMLTIRADQAMYMAKHKGRNRVEVSR